MASIYQLKPRFQALLRPLVRRCHGAGITANQVTLAACAVSLLLGLVLAVWPSTQGLFLLLPLWMFLRMALNAIDGMLAREFGQQSRLGAYLNELCDVIADCALFLPFALVAGIWAPAVVAVAVLAVISEYAGVLGPLTGSGRRYDGPMGKSDRAFCFGVFGLVLGLGWAVTGWINAALLLMAALLLLTIWNRVRHGLLAPSA